MSCIVPKDSKELLDIKSFEAAMQKYGATKANLTESHPFVKQYLQPLLQRIADNIANESGRTEDWQKSSVSVILYDPNNPKKTFSSHDHRTNEIVICWDVKKGLLQDQCRQLLNDTRHESEHANQTDGDGYSTDQRTLSRLSRLSYHPGNNDLYYNNFNEIRARLSEFKMHQAIYEHLVQQNAPFDKRQEAAKNLAAAESHLTHHLSQTAQENWIQNAQRDIKWMWRHTDKLKEAFPDAKNVREAKQMAIQFLQQKAPDILKDLRDEIKAYSQKSTEVMMSIESEREKIAEKDAQSKALDKAKDMGMPILAQMPNPQPNYRLPLVEPTRIEDAFAGKNITLYNRALAWDKGKLHLIGDSTDTIYRDYAHPRPPELTPKSESKEELTPEVQVSLNTHATSLDGSAQDSQNIDDISWEEI